MTSDALTVIPEYRSALYWSHAGGLPSVGLIMESALAVDGNDKTLLLWDTTTKIGASSIRGDD